MNFACYKTNKHAKDCTFVRFTPEHMENGILYASAHPEQKAIVELKDIIITHEKLYGLQEENENLIFDFHRLHDLIAYAKFCRKKGMIPDYMYHAPVATWGLISILRYHQVRDILVTEPLTFDIKQLAMVKKAGTRIHVIPTVCRTPLQQEMEDSGINHFWLLPQHVEYYEDAFDVFEIIDGNTIRQEEIYRLYAEKGAYTTSPMSLLFSGLQVNMPAEVVPTEMILRRLNCQQKCLQGTNPSCQYCEKQLHLWEVVKNRVSK